MAVFGRDIMALLKGEDGSALQMRVDGGYIQWKLETDTEWNNLIAVSELKGADGEDGTDGVSPHIGDNGHWYIGDVDTNVKAEGTDGQDGVSPHIGSDGYWYVGDTNTNVKAKGTDGTDGIDGKDVELQKSATHIQWRKVGDSDWIDLVALSDLKGEDGKDGTDGQNGDDGITPHIGTDGYWYIGDTNTNVKAEGTDGQDGTNGTDGVSPHIGSDGYWYVGDTNTNVKAKGTDGEDGITPHIGENGNWFIGDQDTNVKAEGQDGTDGVTPHVGDNGHWYIGDVDTNVKAEGTDGLSALECGEIVEQSYAPFEGMFISLTTLNRNPIQNEKIELTYRDTSTGKIYGVLGNFPDGGYVSLAHAYVVDFWQISGDNGVGVPAGGTTGQVLKKKSDTDYDTEWANESGGGSGGGGGVEVVDLGTVNITPNRNSVTVSISEDTYYKLTGEIPPILRFTVLTTLDGVSNFAVELPRIRRGGTPAASLGSAVFGAADTSVMYDLVKNYYWRVIVVSKSTGYKVDISCVEWAFAQPN